MALASLTTRGFDVAKIDCECCEYMLIPANKEIFSNRKVVKRLVGELHPYEVSKRILALNGTSTTVLVVLQHSRRYWMFLTNEDAPCPWKGTLMIIITLDLQNQ